MLVWPRRSVGPALVVLLSCVCVASTARGAVPDRIRVGGPSAPEEPKSAIIGSAQPLVGREFTVVSSTGDEVLGGTVQPVAGSPSPWTHAGRMDLTGVTNAGSYTIKIGDLMSPPWVVSASAERALLRDALRIFRVNADGDEPNPVFGPSHLNDAAAPIVGGPTGGGTVDVEGGWRDAGDAIKFTTTTAIASALLDYAALLVPDEAETLHAESDVGVRWLKRAHPRESGTFIAQVGDSTDHVGFRDFATDDASPEPGLSRRKAYGDAGSGPLGAGAAALALAALRPGTSAPVAEDLRTLAIEWYTRGKVISASGPPLDAFEQPGDPALGFYSDWQGYMALAAAVLHRATGEDRYLDDAKSFLEAVDVSYGFSPYFSVGGLAAADLCGGLGRPTVARPDVRELACAKLTQGADAATHAAGLTAFGSTTGFYFGWAQSHTGNAALAAAAGRAGVVSDSEKLAAGARDYLLGRNPWGASFVVGREENAAHKPYHPVFLKGDPIELGRGMVVGGPAVEWQFPEFGITPNPGDAFAPFDPRYGGEYEDHAIIYEDQPGNFINSEVGLAYSAPTVLLLAQLIAR